MIIAYIHCVESLFLLIIGFIIFIIYITNYLMVFKIGSAFQDSVIISKNDFLHIHGLAMKSSDNV